MTAAKKPVVRAAIRHNTSAPGVIQAAQIALVLMSRAKSPDWAGVVAETTLAERVELSDEQQALLEKHRGILPYLTRGGGQSILRSVIACPVCERVMFTTSGSAPARCLMSLGCEGIPVKAKSTQESAPKPEAAPAAA
jgi:hypothetical protein